MTKKEKAEGDDRKKDDKIEAETEKMRFKEALDEINALKVELNEVQKGSEEKVINAMIDNFQLKILILERMLDANTSHFNNSETKDYEINL